MLRTLGSEVPDDGAKLSFKGLLLPDDQRSLRNLPVPDELRAFKYRIPLDILFERDSDGSIIDSISLRSFELMDVKSSDSVILLYP